MRIWFTSDLHFGHENVIKYCNRPYSCAENMDSSLVSGWNSRVSPADTVYCVGDFSLSTKPVETITPKLNGKKILVLGNHDFPHPAHQKSKTLESRAVWENKYREWGWSEVVLSSEIHLLSRKARLFHLPYKGSYPSDSYKTSTPRYESHRLEDDGTLLICGHVHEKWKHKVTDKGTLMVNVGVDVWGMLPVSQEELCEYIDSLS
jgi:calcineurin-like phosphoesterase family protein